jgi:N-acetylglucosamine kinase-like BadF-type ATPase
VSIAPLVAVDAGGSKVDAAILRRDGTVLGAARISHAPHDGVGLTAHLEIVEDAVAAAARDAAIDVDGRPVTDLGLYCIAGADDPRDDRRITGWLRARGLSRDPEVRNDTFAVLRAGTDRTWGVAVVCGHGTNCSAVSPEGRSYRLPALGMISGDWGGGRDLGEAALWHAARSEDGRGRPTALRDLVASHFGLARVTAVSQAIHRGSIPETRLEELVPLVFRAASVDEVAREIVVRQADEIVAMAAAAIRRLRMTRLDVEVVLGGGVFRTRYRPFLSRIREGLTAVAPTSSVSVLVSPPVAGAALLGLDRLGATRAARTRVRDALTETRLSADARARRRGAGRRGR